MKIKCETCKHCLASNGVEVPEHYLAPDLMHVEHFRHGSTTLAVKPGAFCGLACIAVLDVKECDRYVSK